MIRRAPGLWLKGDRFGTLLDVARALFSSPELRGALRSALEILEQQAGVLRGSIAILDPEGGWIRVEAPPGFDPICENAALCAPISLEGETLGTLAVDPEGEEGEASEPFFAVVAALIAQAVAMQRRVKAEQRRLLEQNRGLTIELRDRLELAAVIGTAGPIRGVLEQLARVAPADCPVLIRGERGTGKELIAQAIHSTSRRAGQPFVKMYLAAMPDVLIQSELFGREEGGPTGPLPVKRGRLELAQGGTLFLDDIAELSPSSQRRLLRVLQESAFERLGAGRTLRADVRVLAATSQNLESAVAAEHFRADLYHALGEASIFVPPLRERKPDVLLLAEHFLERYARRYRKSIRRVSTPAIDALMGHDWPGNVRELDHAIEHAVIACDSGVLHAHHLPRLEAADGSGGAVHDSLAALVEQYERDLILDALKSARGSRVRAARLLATTERVIGYKVRKYRIDARRFRTRSRGAR